MQSNPSSFAPGGKQSDKVKDSYTSRFPVETVSWGDADNFCRRLSDRATELQAGRRYRLPTEAEWEYACRAGRAARFNVGESLTASQACFLWAASPMAAGSFPDNPFGLYDMHGNVWEWCADWYGKTYYEELAAARDPTGPSNGTSRVARGGAWSTPAEACASSYRNRYPPTHTSADVGFRVVMEE